MKNRTGKIIAAAILLAVFAASLYGCGPDTNGLWHFECGGCGFTGVDYDGLCINGERLRVKLPQGGSILFVKGVHRCSAKKPHHSL